MSVAEERLERLLQIQLAPEMLDTVQYPALVLERDLTIRCVNAAARTRFGFTDEDVEANRRDRVVAERMRFFHERVAGWLAGAAPRPIPYHWDGESGGDYLLVPFPIPAGSDAFLAVLIPAEMVEEAQAEGVRRGVTRAPKWAVATAAQADARGEAAEIVDADARRLADGRPSALTTREWEIARRIASGDRVSLLAEDLRISPNTVRNHLKAIFRKLGVNSQPQLVRTVRALAK